MLPTLLGTGGSGKVYQGLRIEDGMFVAVKVVQLDKVSHPPLPWLPRRQLMLILFSFSSPMSDIFLFFRSLFCVGVGR